MTIPPPHPIQVVQGDFHVSVNPDDRLATVLGSCVSACLWDAEAGIGGMNHFLLAQSRPGSGPSDIRYGVHAMEMLINALLRGGARRDQLRAKLFGGARITAALRDIGATNAAFARTMLRDEGIPCLAESLGGTQARRIIFHPTTGQARQMLIANTLVHEPASPRPHRSVPCGVELF
jgi:chemotaxis protein CheD